MKYVYVSNLINNYKMKENFYKFLLTYFNQSRDNNQCTFNKEDINTITIIIITIMDRDLNQDIKTKDINQDNINKDNTINNITIIVIICQKKIVYM